MEQKNYTEVFIDGTVFTLGGTEDEAYLRQVAAYLNEKFASWMVFPDRVRNIRI